MSDTATKINIQNAAAKEAFVRWWRMMEAQGYQYGYEALCNVWVGFDDGRADLARKVLITVDDERLHDELDDDGDKGYMLALRHVTAALRELFQREGVNIEQESSDVTE